MKSVVEPLEGNKVKLSVTVDAEEFEPSIDAAWKTIAKQVRIPGFRQGKVPRKVLESRIEPSYARQEALQEALPEFYVKAVAEHEVDVIAQPDFEITAGQEDGDVSFDAVVEVRPVVHVSGYADLTVEIPNPIPSDDDIANQIDQLRNQFADISAVERAATTGDYVSIDIVGSRDGEELDGLTAEDYLYEVGAASIVPELDEALTGASAGDTLEFDSAHPDPSEEEGVHFSVTVKEVRERVLPELTDEWVADATEFTTVAELRDDVIERATKARRAQSTMALQNKLGDALVELVAEDVPEALISSEMRARLEDLVHRLSHQGITLEQYLQITGTSTEQFRDDLRVTAANSSKVDLALRSIAVNEGLVPTDAELDEEIARLAAANDVSDEQLRDQLRQNNQLGPIRSDLGNRNAIRWLTEHITIVDESGATIRHEDLDLDDDEDDHGDHDHDHHDHDHHDHD